jgi:hypothetical protein
MTPVEKNPGVPVTPREQGKREMDRLLSTLKGEPRILLARIWDKVLPDENGCYIWFGWREQRGDYCRIKLWSTPRRHVGVARVVYELLIGPIPEHYWVRHLCGRSRCLRPEHLILEKRG